MPRLNALSWDRRAVPSLAPHLGNVQFERQRASTTALTLRLLTYRRMGASRPHQQDYQFWCAAIATVVVLAIGKVPNHLHNVLQLAKSRARRRFSTQVERRMMVHRVMTTVLVATVMQQSLTTATPVSMHIRPLRRAHRFP